MGQVATTAILSIMKKLLPWWEEPSLLVAVWWMFPITYYQNIKFVRS